MDLAFRSMKERSLAKPESLPFIPLYSNNPSGNLSRNLLRNLRLRFSSFQGPSFCQSYKRFRGTGVSSISVSSHRIHSLPHISSSLLSISWPFGQHLFQRRGRAGYIVTIRLSGVQNGALEVLILGNELSRLRSARGDPRLVSLALLSRELAA